MGKVDNRRPLSEKPLLKGIRQGFMLMTPILIIGACVMAILNFPLPHFQKFMASVFSDSWSNYLIIINNGSLQVLSLLAVICVSYSIAMQHPEIISGHVHVVFPIMGAFSSYVIFQRHRDVLNGVITDEAAGASSMLAALLIAVISVRLILIFYGIFEKLVPEREYSFGGSGPIRVAFRMLLPMLVTIMLFALANMLIYYTGIDDALVANIKEMFHELFAGESIFNIILVIIIAQLLWFFGIDGSSVFLTTYQSELADAAEKGLQVSAFQREFFDIFVFFGGSGSSLALVAALILFGSKYRGAKAGRNSLFPSLFNINEPLLYGFPIVLNFDLCIPFFAAPIAASAISYGAVAAGIMPIPSNEIPWTTPIFFSGYASTGSVSAIFVQLVCFAVAFFIYLPFVLRVKRRTADIRQEVFRDMSKEISYLEVREPNRIMTRPDDIGVLSRMLAHQLSELLSMDGDDEGLHMEFQPKCVKDGRVHGAESLLRWTHKDFGNISPVITLAIAEEAGLGNQLGNWVIRESFKGMKRWTDAGFSDVRLSINLTPEQLNSDDRLYGTIITSMRAIGIKPSRTEFELTENATIDVEDTLINTFTKLRNAGSAFSIDDFGMGHSSLKYLFDFFANVVKLDTSLVQDVTAGEDRKLIVSTILDLCRKLNVMVICEGVETKEQLDILSSLGAQYFQGWYFSKSLKADEMVEYLKRNGSDTDKSVN